jgi:hypothetical protein
MLMGDDSVFSTAPLKVQLLIKFLSNSNIFPLIIHGFNIFNIPLLQQVSYALEMSSDSIAEYAFLHMASMMSVFNIFSTSVVDQFVLNPYCCSARRFLSSSTCTSLLFKILSMILPGSLSMILVDSFLVILRLCQVLG